MDLVFVVDESGSVGSNDYSKAKVFVKEVIDRFNVGNTQQSTRVAYLSFAKSSRTIFNLYAHDTEAAVDSAIDAADYEGGGTCTALAMRMVTDEIFDNTTAGYRPNAAKVVIFITDGNPSYLSYCDVNYPSYDREVLMIALKAKADRIVPVGVGRGITTQFLMSLSHNIPSNQLNGRGYIEIDNGYDDLNNFLNDLAVVACPTAPPTMSSAPTGAPTPIPTFAPTFSCLVGGQQKTCTADAAGNVCDATNGFCKFTDATCTDAARVCECNSGLASADVSPRVCTAAPTATPTTSAPTTAQPTSSPTAPTGAPTYWTLFNTGDNNGGEGAAQVAGTAAAATLTAGAIVAIILGVIALAVLLAMIIGGVGIFAARKKLFPTKLTVDGKNLEKGNAISVGQSIEMTEATASGMVERGEMTPEQFAELGYGEPSTGEQLPAYEDGLNQAGNA
jgi:hypothetical protein